MICSPGGEPGLIHLNGTDNRSLALRKEAVGLLVLPVDLGN